MIFGQARGINLSFRRIIVHRFITIAFVGLMACAVANQTTKTTQNGSISGPTKPEVSAPSTPKTISRKLIEFGWDKPVPAAITTTKLEASPFDGVIFRSSAGDWTFLPKALPVKEFDADIAAFKAIKSKKLENSFYEIQSNANQDWDWFNDAMWKSTEANLAQTARVAKQSGLRGVMFDAETYAFNIWHYKAQARAKMLSFTEYEAKIRERGAQTMRVLEREYPGLTFFTFWWLSNFEPDYAAANKTTNPYATLHTQLEEDGSGLWVAFVEGMLEAASDRVKFVDGNEGSYYYLRGPEFDAARTRNKSEPLQLIRADLRGKYGKQVQFGNAVYLDGIMNLHQSARFFGYYLNNDTDRQNMIAHNTFHGLRSSDEFVWVYGEKLNWWTGQAPVGLDAALRRGQRELLEGKALSDDPTTAVQVAEIAYKARVDVGGDMIGTSGKIPDFGAMQPHCGTWYNASRWSCTQPNGSSFTVTPKLDGVTFDPPAKTFSKLSKSKWAETFTAK